MNHRRYARFCTECDGTGEVAFVSDTTHPYGDTSAVESYVDTATCPACEGDGITDETDEPECCLCGDAIEPDQPTKVEPDFGLTVHAHCPNPQSPETTP